METRGELYYTEEHEWILIEGNKAILGITDYAQNALSDIVYIELPEVGTIIDSEEHIGNIESVKAVSELYSPISGEITAVNKTLEEEPELLNTEPYDHGWIIKLLIDPGEISQISLMDEDEYINFTSKLN